ncbi:MAG: GNAT family N-acetyltransferase [Coriobacteriales bacterium]|nr:GNAT family N-acetyltransferase [Coriobacteriales bacterium]
MRVIKAVWELENLGKHTTEFELEPGDDKELCDLIAAIGANEQEYNVIKLDSSLSSLLLPLAQNGYSFIESQFIFLAQYDDLKMNSIQQRIANSISVRPMALDDSDAMQRLFYEVSLGMFDTDRIALDPHFGVQVSAKRYINWLKSAMQGGSQVYEYIYKEKPIGFSAIKDMPDASQEPFLGGMYDEFRKSGLGMVIVAKDLQIIANNGTKAAPVAVSSNNPAVWKLYLQLGYTLLQVKHVLVKHA